MLNAKENLREALKPDGHPDRFVNSYEFIRTAFGPNFLMRNLPNPGELDKVTDWGVHYSFPIGTPGPFPLDTPDKVLIADIDEWRDILKAPPTQYPDELWNISQAMMDEIDGEKCFKACFVAPGLFENLHAFCGITDALVYLMTDEDEVKELLKYVTEWELRVAEQLCSRLHPDAILHHDDWGSEQNSFMRPEMFAEFFVEPYKEIYGYYHDHGVELIVHHNDSYGANLVPYMIEMGIDIWQGCMRSNDVPTLVDRYKGEIAFMGNIDNKQVDFDGWQEEDCEKAARLAVEGMDPHSYIPCITQGIPGSVYPGTYRRLVKYLDQCNSERFGHSVEDLQAARDELQVLEYELELIMPDQAERNKH